MQGLLTIPFILLLSLFFGQNVFGQLKWNKKNKVNYSKASNEKLTYGDFDLFNFSNVNDIPYYYEKREVNKIAHFNSKQDWDKLYPILKKYVSNFGIANFYKSTYWLWRLAKVSELKGYNEEARLLYNLALKHYKSDIKINTVELFYDSLTEESENYYVPLEYYYALVEHRSQVDTLRPPRGVLLNMGRWINSEFSDYGPALSSNDDLIVFTSKRDLSKDMLNPKPIENLYYSKKYGDTWETAEQLKGINSELNEGSPCLSKDGKQLFFSKCEAPDGYGSCDLYMAELQGDTLWTNITNLGQQVNSGGWDSHPALTHSEDTLYYASDRIGGFGLADIYFTVKDKDGNWTLTQNAGPIINSRKNEVSPFYHHRSDVLYFSSNGQLLNFGEFDIYKTQKKNGNWIEPKNIGPLVNGPGSEFYFAIDGKSENLYYARSAENTVDNFDLYSFPLPMEAQPGASTKVTGTLTDSGSGDPVSGIVSIIDLKQGIEVAPKFLKPDGSFEFDLINNSDYLLIVQGEKYFRIEEIFHLDGDMEIKAAVASISTKLEFESIVFESSKALLSPGMYDDIDKLVKFLLDNPSFKLRISGHTNSDGREAFNLELSQKRADAIMEYMVFFGSVEETRIESRGYGSSQPILDESIENAKELNRRVEFELYTDSPNE